MERQPVESSSVISVGYDEAEQVLEVEFAGGGVYQYFDVAPWQYEQLLRADSIGRYVNGYIKPNHRYLPA